jgi:serine/threonine protein phosphatase PrpC
MGGIDMPQQRSLKGLKVGVICDRGVRRPYNEDSTLVLRFVQEFKGSLGRTSRTCWILAVADGMGGHESGDVASRIALTTSGAEMLKQSVLTSIEKREICENALTYAYNEANLKVLMAGEEMSKKPDYKGRPPGSTLVIAYVVGNELYIANAGDSRGYTLNGGKIKRVTKDDSYVQDLIDQGNISEEDARVHPRRNEITNAVGIFPPDQFKPSVNYLGNILDCEYIFLCTDGLHGVVTDSEISNIIYQSKKISTSCMKLLDLAKKRGGPDNISLVLAKIVPDVR